jgi:o-succinylbenzoate---CoA ligase
VAAVREVPVPDLVALAMPPSAMARWLPRVWDEGDAVLPLAPATPRAELDLTLERLRPAVLGTLGNDGEATFERLRASRGVPSGTALVVATSGSTGQPRGVRLTHRAVTASTEASIARLGCVAGQPWLTCLPTHHVAGIQTLLRSWAVGADPVVHDGFDVDAVAAVVAGDAAPAVHVSLVPTQLWRLLEAGIDVARFETILLGGARAPASLLDRARGAGANVVVSYGMTETCGGCVYDGLPLDGVEVDVDAQRRVRLRGAVLLSGYHVEGEAAAPSPLDGDGWFVTGDVGRFVGGRLEIQGRADDMVLSGGENVPLEAVVETLLSHPAVADAAALGREDEEWGEVVVAAVVARDADAPPSLEQLREHVKARHTAAFAPREVTFVEAIPRGPLGKVPRAALEDLLRGA